ncbi:hypothetical protein DFR56_105139 [Pseudogracilibacillus auburnensis]|uniref:Uncharacterized protein n=1 Tax=Pseudogracilibacillus auburnensis TaxID=1494959 RepID=A0A2V3VZL2_9BACI|nr:hypothetical protein [Pseudogracilibacillus auburnensis]PXW87497.1 hypothetical protein DFR56_105139 [Pseudogracilibacillus auburnensis]
MINIVILASVIAWIGAIHELNRSSKKQNDQKIITLVSLGTLSTLIISRFNKGKCDENFYIV